MFFCYRSNPSLLESEFILVRVCVWTIEVEERMGDKISGLPDTILSHILSFVPTKTAVATSALSKRWKSVWRSVPIWDFDDSSYTHATYSSFVQSVYMVMLSLLQSRHQIQSFRLKCRIPTSCLGTNINAWVNAVVESRIEDLQLFLPTPPSLRWHINLPSSVLTSTTLVVLKLSRFTFKPFSPVHIPSLKYLQLNNVIFVDHPCLAQFLSGCPNLESFIVMGLRFSTHSVHAEFQSFPKLIRTVIFRLEIPLIVVSYAKFLRIDWTNHVDPAINPCYTKPIPTFHNLTHIRLVFSDYKRDYMYGAVEVLIHSPKLLSLEIEKENLHCFPDFDGEGYWPGDPQPVPVCLLLHLKRCSLTSYKGLKGELQFVSYVLQNARHLQMMVIKSQPQANQQQKLRMITQLSLCPRGSPACKLSFK
ncbi:hypothetical protein RJT34_15975 [Clitoria ternatea]|uniref:F-box domain-containing protein n=1 Tax=Clitoria ternatea TaxID=43366 RepID=A0AAN9J7I3_CLITE